MLKPVAFGRRPSSTLADITTRFADIHDVDALVAMHERCSETSLYRRFHAPLPRVPARLVRQLVAPTNGWSRVAVHKGEAIAFACAAAVSASDLEVGLLVEDRHQHKGLGTRMLHELAVEAAARGFSDLQLFAQPENDRVLSTVQKAGLLGRVSWHDSLLCVAMSVRRLAPEELPQPA